MDERAVSTLLVISTTSGLASGVVVTLLTQALSRRAFVSQRWWEAKARVYKSIVRSIGRVLVAVRDLYDEFKDAKHIDSEATKRCYALWERAGQIGDELVMQGEFLISPEAMRSLEPIAKLIRNEPKEAEFLRWLEDYGQALIAVRDAFRLAAKKDLGVG